MQEPGLAPNVIFGSTFFTPLAADLKNSTALLKALQSQNISTIVDINAREWPETLCPLDSLCTPLCGPGRCPVAASCCVCEAGPAQTCRSHTAHAHRVLGWDMCVIDGPREERLLLLLTAFSHRLNFAALSGIEWNV